jgi:hypothetical protein
MPPSHRAGRALLAVAIVAVFGAAVAVAVVSGGAEWILRAVRP